MSSYQFVNTIAQCYAEAGQAAGAAAATSQDYYNMNYPNCYSPNLNNHANYNQYSLMMSGQAAAAAMATAVNDYNSLTAANGGGSGGSAAAAAAAGAAANPQQVNTAAAAAAAGAANSSAGASSQQAHLNTGQRQSANHSPRSGGGMAQNNCKFELNDSSMGGSPQDLRTTSADGTIPHGLGPPGGPGGGPGDPKSPSSPTVSQPPLSPLTSSPAAAASIAAAVAAAAHAHQTSSSSSSQHQQSGNNSATTNSTSNNNSGSSGGGGGGSSKRSGGGDKSSSSGDSPQIYPWMKRVHLGQSKSFITLYPHQPSKYTYTSSFLLKKNRTLGWDISFWFS